MAMWSTQTSKSNNYCPNVLFRTTAPV